MQEMNAQELKAHLDGSENPPLLLDVRQPWEFDICKLEGSRLIPMAQIPACLDELGSGEQGKDLEIVVICHHGIRSRSVGRYLEHEGFRNIINLSGGIDQWAKTVDTGMPSY